MFKLFFSGLLAAAVLAGVSPPASAQGGDEVNTAEVIRLGNMVQAVGRGHQDEGLIAFQDVMGPPADDNHKWFISVITTKNCPHCDRLKRDLTVSPYLRAFVDLDDQKKSWAHANVYLYGDKSQDWRWKNIKFAGFPTIIVQPPINRSYGDPTTVVMQHTGYDGNAKKLAEKISGTIRSYIKKLQPVQRQAWEHTAAMRNASMARGHSQDIGVDPPWTPRPKDDPVSPGPAPILPPVSPVDVPVFPDTPSPSPKPDETQPPSIPDTPEAVVVTDTKTFDDDHCQHCLETFLAEQRSRLPGLRVRFIDFRDAKEKYPVTKDELPTVFITDEGKIENKVSGKLLPSLLPEPRQVGITDLPWASILALFTTGFSVPVVIGLGVGLARWFRARRLASGQAPLLNDQLFEQLMASAPVLAEKLAELLAKKAPPPDPEAKSS